MCKRSKRERRRSMKTIDVYYEIALKMSGAETMRRCCNGALITIQVHDVESFNIII